ncbi:MAG: response regulator transcription factor [Bacteroidales bacterium]|nr:response regulator transcription factor [Bacteroidales bacterium]
MNCIAIDDEPLALDVIKDFASKMPVINLISVCTSAVDAISILHEKKIDLIFLDIQMPHITGLDFLKVLNEPPMVIFTTAFSDHALQGFELNAVDYLLKPFSFERFLKAVHKALQIFTMKQSLLAAVKSTPADDNADFMMVKVEYSMIRLDLSKVLYIEGLKDYVKIYSGGRPLLTKTTMKNLEEKLPLGKFIRVHKSFIISLSKIDSIENNRIRIGEKYIPVGNQYRQVFYGLVEKIKL